MSDVLAVLAFIGLSVGIFYMNMNTMVHVHFCDQGNLTTYVRKVKPPTELKLGTCRVESMTNERYYKLRKAFKKRVSVPRG